MVIEQCSFLLKTIKGVVVSTREIGVLKVLVTVNGTIFFGSNCLLQYIVEELRDTLLNTWLIRRNLFYIDSDRESKHYSTRGNYKRHIFLSVV